MKHLKKEFELLHPKTKILLESSGSRTAARKISDLHKPADIMASADYTVIYDLLVPVYADFCINFATNEMSLVYSSKSKYADRINKDNWFDIILKDGVEYGHSDPNQDPCGYRSQLVWQLAEQHYKQKNLYQKLRQNCPLKNIRPKEVDLLALLDAGALDYIFLYRSVAIQHDLPYLQLPAKINLSSYQESDFYKKASIAISGKKPGEKILKTGKAIVYGVTIPKKAPNHKGATEFLKFMFSPSGMNIFAKLGQKPFLSPETKEIEKIPVSLKTLVKAI
jgi:molybdate/tungstate transport system substrate-binding protein